MADRRYRLTIDEDLSLQVHSWLPSSPPVASLLIVHGMAEHGARYARLAKTLTARGYAVHAPDLPGHGLTAKAKDRGWFAARSGWARVLDAIHRVRLHLASESPQAPLFFFGHSMGSFLGQHYLVEHGDGLAGAILSATSATMGPLRRVGIALLLAESLFRGRRAPAAVADAMGFKQFNKAFAPTRTDFDWLSRDPIEVDRYVADPLCGFRCSAQLWLDLLHAGASLRDPHRLAQIPKTLPVLLIAGSRDPVSLGERGPSLLAEAYRKAGLKDVSLRIWPEGRHELLNDSCRDEVMHELGAWLDGHRQ